MKDRDANVRKVAAAALAAIGPKAEAAAPELVGALRDEDLRVQAQAANALVQIGAPAVPSLVAILEEPRSASRVSALYVLGQIGPGASGAVQILGRTLKERDPLIVRLAAVALGHIGPDARDALPLLTDLLQADHADLRISAALALARIEPDNKAALDRLNQEVARSAYGKPSPAVLAQMDSRRQAEIQRYLDLFIYVTSFRFGDGLKQESHQLMDRLGPDAIPALVRTLNLLFSDARGKERILLPQPIMVEGKLTGERTFFFF